MIRSSKLFHNLDLWLAIFLFLSSAFLAYKMDDFVFGGIEPVIPPSSFPRLMMLTIAIFSLLLTCLEYRNHKKSKHKASPSTVKSPVENKHTGSTVIYVATLFAYLLLLHIIGFLISTPLVMLVVMLLLGARNFKVNIPVCIVFSFAVYYGAYKLMNVLLPTGLVFQ